MKKSNPVYYSVEEKNALINQWRHSGKTKKEFSAYRGIKPQTFYSWFKPGKPNKEKHPAQGFVPLQINPLPVSEILPN